MKQNTLMAILANLQQGLAEERDYHDSGDFETDHTGQEIAEAALRAERYSALTTALRLLGASPEQVKEAKDLADDWSNLRDAHKLPGGPASEAN